MLKTNTSKKIVQNRHQSALDVLKSLALAVLLSYSKSVVSIVLIIAAFFSPVVQNYDSQN